MARQRCAVCSKGFEAKRSTAKYCSSSCRAKASKRPKTAKVSFITVSDVDHGPNDDPKPDLGLVEVTRAKLTAVNRLDSVAGQQAIMLARRMATELMGSAVSSLSKEFRAVMDLALEGTAMVGDPLDELEKRRAAKLAAR